MLKKVKAALEKNRYTVRLFDTKEDARDYLCSLFHEEVIGFGDSATMDAMELHEHLAKDNIVIDPKIADDNDHFLEIARRTLTTPYYLLSANAITEDGVIVNLDGTGNRVAGSLFGHKKVFYIIGRNKITKDLEQAIYRVRNVAAPMNAKRYQLKTPCALKGDKCYDCSSPDRICNGLLIEYKKMNDTDMEVLLIDEDLGF